MPENVLRETEAMQKPEIIHPLSHSFVIATISLLLVVAATVASSAGTDWALVDKSCSGVVSALEVPCGSVGVYHFVGVRVPSGCEVYASGEEDPPWYPPPFHLDPFSDVPDPEPIGPVEDLTDESNWVAVIDFLGPHGESTSWLVNTVSGPEVETDLSVLDDAELAPLGTRVNDFHVLAKLCRIAEMVDEDGAAAPLVINMSFGRRVRPNEPLSSADCQSDEGSLASCQIVELVDHLSGRGSRLIAAAGNHRQTLYPAVLDQVLPAAMLDLDAFLPGDQGDQGDQDEPDRVVQPVWESDSTVRALFPGNSLCLKETWAAPAGSSYSSAMFSGWIADVLWRGAQIDEWDKSDEWEPQWDSRRGCYLLARNGRAFPWCNTEVQHLFDGLEGGNEDGCWAGVETDVIAPDADSGKFQPDQPSYDAWTAEFHPTPESDPCVPCIGRTMNADIELDLSQSPSLPESTFLDAVYFRSGNEFYALQLSRDDLGKIADGHVGTLIVPGMAGLMETASLWYLLKQSDGATCETLNTCYWSSTPIRFLP